MPARCSLGQGRPPAEEASAQSGAWLIAVLWAVAIAARLTVGPHIVDDAYITMRYSRNLAATGSLSYNPPDAVLGTSSPLWTSVLAVFAAAGVAPETAAVVLSSIADLASIAVIVTAGGSTLMGAAAGVTIAARPAYVAYALSGMETSLYVLLVISFAAALSRRAVAVGAVIATLGALCRPDGALLAVVGCGWLAATRSRREALRFGALVTLLCTPWLLYAFFTFGSIVPASVAAKAAAEDPWFLSLQNLSAYFLRGVDAPLTVLAAAGAALTVVAGHAFWRLWTLWALAYVSAMTAANGFTHFPWYFVPILPVLTASGARAVEDAWRASSRIRGLLLRPFGPARLHATPWRPPANVALVAAVGVVLLSRMPVLRAELDEQTAGREALYAAVAIRLAGVDARCTVAATEIGAIGYHYPGRILDLVGLVSPEAVRRPAGAVLAEGAPRWLVTYDTHFDRRVASSEAFTAIYGPPQIVRVGHARQLEVYERRDRAGCGGGAAF